MHSIFALNDAPLLSLQLYPIYVSYLCAGVRKYLSEACCKTHVESACVASILSGSLRTGDLYYLSANSGNKSYRLSAWKLMLVVCGF